MYTLTLLCYEASLLALGLAGTLSFTLLCGTCSLLCVGVYQKMRAITLFSVTVYVCMCVCLCVVVMLVMIAVVSGAIDGGS